MNSFIKSITLSLSIMVSTSYALAITPADITTDTISESRTFKFQEAGNTFYLRHDLNLEWPKAINGFNDIAGLQGAIITSVFNNSYPNLQDAIKSLDKFEKTDAMLVDSIPSTVEKKCTAEEIGTVKFKSCNKEIMCYEIIAYSQNAGAAGVTFNSFLNYDMATGKTFIYKNTFIPGARKGIISSLQKALMEKEGYKTLAALEEAGYDFSMIENPENFYFDNDNIYFVFHPYEITAETEDSVTIAVPKANLMQLLSPEAKAAIK